MKVNNSYKGSSILIEFDFKNYLIQEQEKLFINLDHTIIIDAILVQFSLNSLIYIVD